TSSSVLHITRFINKTRVFGAHENNTVRNIEDVVQRAFPYTMHGRLELLANLPDGLLLLLRTTAMLDNIPKNRVAPRQESRDLVSPTGGSQLLCALCNRTEG